MGDVFEMMDYLTNNQPKEKREGFRGQQIFFASAELRRSLARHPMVVGLQTIHMGWFPSARHHTVVRPQGSPEAIVIFCQSGGGHWQIGGVRERLDAGEVLFVPPETPHHYAADIAHPWSIYWAHFSGTVVPSLLAQLPEGTFKLVLPGETARETVSLFRRSLRLFEQGHTLRTALAASHYLRAIFGCCFFVGHRPDYSKKAVAHDFSNVIRLMQNHTANSLSLAVLSREAGLSPSRFSALFRSRTGISPGQYHLRLRMQAACQLLDATGGSIKEIAAQCGYEDPYYFSRIFKTVTGLSPTEYRSEQKG